MRVLNFNRIAIFALIFLLIFLSLISTDYFYDQNKFSYLAFCTIVFALLILSVFSNAIDIKAIKAPVLLFLLWCVYAFVQFICNMASAESALYFFCLFILLFSISGLAGHKIIDRRLLFYGIILISTLQSCCCIMQFFGLLRSQNPYFDVTGSYSNPNVTAIFLALATPAYLSAFKGRFRKILIGCFLMMLSSLILLKCRAAFIGTILSALVFYSLEYNFIGWMRDAKNKTAFRGLLIIFLIILIPLSSQIYNAKKESSDGRKFIWKVSALMALEKPFAGYGYGTFEKKYNLYQAKYIGQGKAHYAEIKNAGPVIMPHNEILYNFTEGGAIGLFFMGAFFCSLVATVKNRENCKCLEQNGSNSKKASFNAAFSGVIAFVGMSMVNSTIQIVPLMVMLIIYAGLLSETLRPLMMPEADKAPSYRKAGKLFAKSAAIAVGCCFMLHLFASAKAQRQNKIADLLQKDSRLMEASQIMMGLKEDLCTDGSYWKNYGLINLKMGRFSEALRCLEESKKYSSLPELYLGAAVCYEKSGMYSQAVKEYRQLVMILPSKFSYRFSLMKAYMKNKDTINAQKAAEEILRLEPRIPSQKVHQYKNAAAYLLKTTKKIEISAAKKKDNQALSFTD